MNSIFKSREWTRILSGMALLSLMGRTFIDYGYVFPKFGIVMPDLLPITLGMLAFYGVWRWALIAAARGSRKALIAILVYDVLLLVFGVSTFTTLCPSPCGTAWPLGELLMWSTVIIGGAATVAVLGQLADSRRRRVRQTT